jgi:superfamily II DNA or RNA helicase
MMELFADGAGMDLRQYQKDAVEATMPALENGDKPLIIMATGTGKTVVFSEIIRRYLECNKKSLVIAHREELLNQAQKKIGAHTGHTASIEMATDYGDKRSMVVVGSVPTLRERRLERFSKHHFDLIVTDEAHHAPAISYRKIFNYFDQASLLGVTATPDRADAKSLGKVFNKIAYEYPLHRAIKDGFLCPILGRRIKDFSIDLSAIKITAGDFSISELEKKIEEYLAPLAKSIKAETEGISTLVYMPDVRSSALMAEALNAIGLKADFISGATEKSDRRQTLYHFSTGNITHLVSCNVLTEGFDEPRVEAIAMCRPTGSRSLYAQIVGRGTRLYPGKKFLKLVEFTFNSERLKLVTAYELFSTLGYGERVQAKAVKIGERQEYEDFLNNVETAKTQHEDLPRLMEEALKKTKDYSFATFDPVGVGDMLGIDISGEFDITYNGRKLEGQATDKQRDLLSRYGVVGEMSKAQASALLERLLALARPSTGRASESQKFFLIQNGYRDTANLSMAMASALIAEIKMKDKFTGVVF